MTEINASEAISYKRTIRSQQSAAWRVKGGNTEKQKELRTRIQRPVSYLGLPLTDPGEAGSPAVWADRKKNIRRPRERSPGKNKTGMVRKRVGT